MVPTELMPRTVPMLTDALPQLLDFIHELLTRHPVEVLVHDLLQASRDRYAETRMPNVKPFSGRPGGRPTYELQEIYPPGRSTATGGFAAAILGMTGASSGTVSRWKQDEQGHEVESSPRKKPDSA
jgi:hypothetical protein